MESTKKITKTRSKTSTAKTSVKPIQAEFLAIISHALRTPLDTLIGIAHLLQKQKFNTLEAQSYGDFILAASQDLLSLADDILSFSPARPALLKNKVEPVDLAHLIEQIIHANAYRAQEKGIELSLKYPEQLPKKVLADPRRIRQLMLILINNALNSTHTGYVHIDVTSKPTSHGQSRMQITVSDTGIGIHEDQLEQLPIQLSSTTEPQKQQESSYNLAIASYLAETLGSKAIIDSKLGKGTAVRFTLPIAKSAEDTKDSNLWAKLAGLNCMLIDDNAVRCRLTQSLLETAGVRVKALTTDDFLLALASLAHSEPYQIAMINADNYNQHTAYLGRILRNSASFQESLIALATVQPLLDYERDQALSNGYNSVLQLSAHAHFLTQTADAWQGRFKKRQGFEPQNPLTNQRILLVEDNQLSQKVNSLMLSELGFVVDIAADGQTALQKLGKHNYNLVFMDINLPDINGLEVTSIYRRQEKKGQHTPIIGLTTQTQANNRELSLTAGMDDFLAKPLLQEQLQTLFSRWLPTQELA